MKLKGWLVGGLVLLCVLPGICCCGYLLLGRVNFFPGGYWEGAGKKHPISEHQVIQAEFGFDLPPSASDVRLAVHGGKDYGLSGSMFADDRELDAVLIAGGYSATGQQGFRSWADRYPQMTWFEVADTDVQAGYTHPDHDGYIVVTTLRDAGGRAEVFFQRWSGKRSPVTWQYFE